MRRILLTLAGATLALSLPGCLFAYNERADEWHSEGFITGDCCEDCFEMSVVERQVAQMDRHLRHECKPDCPYCKSAALEAK